MNRAALIFARVRNHVAAYSILFSMGFSFLAGMHGLVYHRSEPRAWDAILVLILPPIVAALCIWLPGDED